MGDLNFRLVSPTDSFDQTMSKIRSHQIDELLRYDQLKMAQINHQAFYHFDELQINFLPTFKFELGTNRYSAKRTPSYTDRILYRSKYKTIADEDHQIIGANYMARFDVTNSDHKPVSAEFCIPPALNKLVGKVARKRHVRRGSLLKYLTRTARSAEHTDGQKDLGEQEPCLSYARQIYVQFAPIDNWSLERFPVVYFHILDNNGHVLSLDNQKLLNVLSSWDWVGLFRADYTSLEDYKAFAYPFSDGQIDVGQDALTLDNEQELTVTAEESSHFPLPPPSSSSLITTSSGSPQNSPFLTATSRTSPRHSLERSNSHKHRSRTSTRTTDYGRASSVTEEIKPSPAMATGDSFDTRRSRSSSYSSNNSSSSPKPSSIIEEMDAPLLSPNQTLSRAASRVSLASIHSNLSISSLSLNSSSTTNTSRTSISSADDYDAGSDLEGHHRVPSITSSSLADTKPRSKSPHRKRRHRHRGEGASQQQQQQQSADSSFLFKVIFDDEYLVLQPGKYVLIYLRKNGDVLGVSDSFDITE